MSYSSLSKYYDDLFRMKYQHGFGLEELSNLIPYERDIMIQLVNTSLAEKEELDRLQALQDRNYQNARR